MTQIVHHDDILDARNGFAPTERKEEEEKNRLSARQCTKKKYQVQNANG